MKLTIILLFTLITTISFSQDSTEVAESNLNYIILKSTKEKIYIKEGTYVTQDVKFMFTDKDGKKRKFAPKDIAIHFGNGSFSLSMPLSENGFSVLQHVYMYSDQYILLIYWSDVNYAYFTLYDTDFNIVLSKLDVHPTKYPVKRAEAQVEESLTNLETVMAYFDCNDAFEALRESIIKMEGPRGNSNGSQSCGNATEFNFDAFLEKSFNR